MCKNRTGANAQMEAGELSPGPIAHRLLVGGDLTPTPHPQSCRPTNRGSSPAVLLGEVPHIHLPTPGTPTCPGGGLDSPWCGVPLRSPVPIGPPHHPTAPPIPHALRREETSRGADWGKFQAPLTRGGSLRATRRPSPTGRALTELFRGQPRTPIPKCPGPRPPPRLVVLQRGRCVSRARRCLAGQGGNGWSGGPLFQPQHTPLAKLWRNVGDGFRCRPAPPAPTHTHTERGRGSSAFSPGGSSAQLPPRTRHLQQRSTTPPVEAVGRPGGTDVGGLPLHSPELSRRGKKGRDKKKKKKGMGGVPYPISSCRPCRGRRAPTSTVLAAGPLPPAWKGGDIHPIPKPREPTKLRPISLISSGLKRRENGLRDSVAVGPSPSRVWFTRGGGTATPPHPGLSQKLPHSHVFLDLEKGSSWPVLTHLPILARKGDPGKMLAWSRTTSTPPRAEEEGRPALPRLAPPCQLRRDLALVVTGGVKLCKRRGPSTHITAKLRGVGLKFGAKAPGPPLFKAPKPACRCAQASAWPGRTPTLPRVWLEGGCPFTAQLDYLKERPAGLN
ncbi:hypothetical protein GWK47_028828 [Chionoecetes opilio]|uniref:Uncharacterized protein n=1 Tax=Chionoecetes opilio TaxID=41210 RepID=A0A8J4YYF4_CHIOP|nr:hypothetical protein GWK47_028828 [Chionoecetes opilio]